MNEGQQQQLRTHTRTPKYAAQKKTTKKQSGEEYNNIT